MLTYDDLTGLDWLGDLVGTAHLREADPSYDKDDEAWACPAFILSTGFVLLTGAVEQRTDDTRLKYWGGGVVQLYLYKENHRYSEVADFQQFWKTRKSVGFHRVSN